MSRAPTQTCGNEQTVNPQTDLGWLLATSHQLLIAEADRQLAPLDLTASQYGVVAMLATGEASTPTELCRLMDYNPGAMTRLLQRLEAKGVLTRVPGVTDRRRHTLALTGKGVRLYEQAHPIIDKLHSTMLEGLDAEQAKALATLLCRVIRNLG